MPKRSWTPRTVAAMLGVCLCGAVHAVEWHPAAVEVLAGPGDLGLSTASAGLVWAWKTRVERRGLFTGQTELILSHWRAPASGGGHQGLQQVTLLPVLRIGPDHGHSPWYIEMGIGASWLDREFATPDRTFATRWNFYDMLGGGYRLGARREHEIGLRLVHISNAGLKLPNPGQQFLLLRYAYRF